MLGFWRDLRSAARSLLGDPGFTVVSIATLTLAIGATTAIFTVVKSVLLDPLPYPESERIVVVQESNPDAGLPRFAMSPLNFRDYRDQSSSFSAFAAGTGAGLALTGADGSARRLSGRAVTAAYLQVMGIGPALGRDFSPADDEVGAPPTMILSHSLWQDLGGEADIVGSQLTIDGETTTVIGVLPAGTFHDIDAFVPHRHDYEDSSRGAHYWIGLARLAKGVEIEQARAELSTIGAGLAATYPDANTGWTAIIDPLKSRTVENVETALWVLLGSVGLVLLIACANVANLTLARTANRGREIALRTALGASRFRLVRRLLAESLLLGVTAAILGVGVAYITTRALVSMNADRIPRAETIAIDNGVLIFGLALAIVTALVVGFVPAYRATGDASLTSLRESGRAFAGSLRGLRLRRGLVLAEVALALVILIGAGLLVRSFSRLVAVDPGFRPDGVWTVGISFPDRDYGEDGALTAFLERLLDEGAAVPGVDGLATVFPMPFSGNDWINTFYREGQPLPGPNEADNLNVNFVSPAYFETLGIPLLEGRTLNRSDRTDAASVVVINQSAATRFWQDRDPVGTRISFGRPDGDDTRWFEVVGVVGDVHLEALENAIEPTVYRSALQGSPQYATVVARTTGSTEGLAGSLRQLVARIDPNLAIDDSQSARALIDDSLATTRFNTTLLSSFAGLALLLAAVGVFGVVTYGVTQRLRELGVRMALGARNSQILTLVLREGMAPVLIGIVVGLVSALAASRLLSSLVYEVGTNDPLSYAVGGIVLAAVAAIACLVPAIRATRLNPLEVLRED